MRVARIALSLIVLVLVGSAAPPAARAGPWRRPVDGPLLRAFRLAADPYARGQHRGVDLGAALGSPVSSACTGRVRFAGRVPGGGRTVSIRCGPLVATYQQLATIAVGAGQRVGRGARIGAIGPSSDPRERRPHLHLGARSIASGRYVDPMTLLAGAPPPALPQPAPDLVDPPDAVGPAPLPVRPRLRTPDRIAPPRPVGLGPAPLPLRPVAPDRIVPPRPVGPGPAPLPLRPVLPALRPPPASSPRRGRPATAPDAAPGAPWVVWVGLAGIASALPVGGLVAVRRRRRHPTGRAVATVR